MITNAQEFEVSKAQFNKLRNAAANFDVLGAVSRADSPILAQAELAALKSQVEELAAELREYEVLNAGTVTLLKAKTLSDLPAILIRARIGQGLSQHVLAAKLGLDEQQIRRYEAESYASASLQQLNAVAAALRLNISEVAELRQGEVSDRQQEATAVTIDWSRFPVKEMFKRNWFEGLFSGPLSAAMANADALVEAFVSNAIRRPTIALQRQRVRTGSIPDSYALLAWQCRILTLAKLSAPQNPYRQSLISNEWLRELVQLSRFPNGPIRAKRHLANVGITLVIEPHLPSTHLDGAALLGDKSPVIGLTLRYDRLDNFWFVLLHELIHIKKHLRRGEVENVFDDLDAEPDTAEREADQLAGQTLIPDDRWETALARYVRSEESIKSLATELRISPSIIAGRIRKEAENYVILNDLIGQGEVRKLFPEVRFEL